MTKTLVIILLAASLGLAIAQACDNIPEDQQYNRIKLFGGSTAM